MRIAVCGLGAAGRARLQALAQTEGVAAAGVISRRPDCSTLSWPEALRDPTIDAIAVSTENTDHAGRVREALMAEKHVLCDYPLATQAKEARDLFRLAAEKKRVLHVEHIALLSEEHLTLKKQVKILGPLKKGEYLFQGGWNEKLAALKRSGPPPLLALSRLLQVADLFGPFGIESHRLDLDANGMSLHLHLKFPEAGLLGFTENRRNGLQRRRSLLVECAEGPLAWRSGSMSGGLFAKDLQWFRDRVEKAKGCYYEEETMCQILEFLETVSEQGALR